MTRVALRASPISAEADGALPPHACSSRQKHLQKRSRGYAILFLPGTELVEIPAFLEAIPARACGGSRFLAVTLCNLPRNVQTPRQTRSLSSAWVSGSVGWYLAACCSFARGAVRPPGLAPPAELVRCRQTSRQAPELLGCASSSHRH